MAVKGKVAKAKRNNQKRNKLVKQGVIKKNDGKPKKNIKAAPPKVVKKPEPQDDSEESDHGEDLLEMVDEEDIDFLKQAISNRSYKLLNKVKYTGPVAKKIKVDDDDLENNYEEINYDDSKNIKMRSLLPIKTKNRIIPREIVDTRGDATDEEEEVDAEEENDEAEASDAEEYTLEDHEFDAEKPISATQLLATRNEVLRQRKIHIGTLSSGLLENPEEKITNLRTLLKIMDEETPEVYLTVRKLVIVSLVEVFKDILPSYEIKNINASSDGPKLKKDTLKLFKFEENLLQYYKKFLQKLEKYCLLLMKKKGNSKPRSEEELKMGELAVHAMCDLLVAHPYFNFAPNIAQVLVPCLNNPRKSVRETVKAAVKTIIKEDKKEEITLKILRIINQYLKNHTHNTNTDTLEVLLVLNLRDVNLDREKEVEMKQKKLMSHKSNVLQISKKERKRKKKLKMLEQELLETKAEENVQTKQKNLTEITKIVFNIYFRILKNSSNSKVLGVCLEGLAKFAHCINLEYYVDIVNVLDSLLKEDWLGYKEQLHCVQTVFAILGGQGEAINLDPTRFYNSLYKDMFKTTAARNHDNILILLKTLDDALIKRRKKITNKRMIGFIKRLATLSLQLLHNGSLGCLSTIKNIMQLNRAVDILLDLDNAVGEGKFQPDLDDPEYSNAATTAMYEMTLLRKHYHPIVNKYANNIASGVPATGEGSLPSEYWKSTPEQLFTEFSMSEMGFNPQVPIPNKAQPKNTVKRIIFADNTFETECRQVLKAKRKNACFWIDDSKLLK
ncbi:unnamed protein product [Brassicogethes aeneus]|uniref:NOC3-like protein n=1 Tax=Brassicogethes aeneus TaxID=1431903 RepID=A0A9P0AXI8_BRAAE|nr:unnamed protein product [Brassicogethes aeneus]